MNNFIRSLPLVASALGRKYGLQVVIGGERAATNGHTIYLPSLPLDASPELVVMARGFIDHEAAHVRATNLKALKAANLNPLEKHVWNIIEDWRAEKALGDIFPGCRQNFEGLIRHMFDKEADPSVPRDLEILNWMLLTVRSWSVPDLAARVDELEPRLEAGFPGLLSILRAIFTRIKHNCQDTKAAIGYAREIVKTLKMWAKQESNQTDSTPKPSTDSPQSLVSDQPGFIIDNLLNKPEAEHPQGFGAFLGEVLNQAKSDDGNVLRVAEVCPRPFDELSDYSRSESVAVTKALKCKLQSRLQALTLKPVNVGQRGRLDTKRIHKLFASNPKIFRRDGYRIGHNTAIHLLIDASGSMQSSISLVNRAAYALCLALSQITGLNLGASVFPGQPTKRTLGRDKSWETISPLLKHGQAMHHNFQLTPAGGTPMGEAIWWALQEMAPLKETRKIIMILTDGDPDYFANTQAAIAEGQRLGFELYGLGLGSTSIKSLLPHTSIEITHLSELPPKMFELLGQAFTRRTA